MAEKILKYIPHGISSKQFFPIDITSPKYGEFFAFKKALLGEKNYSFILLYNARNIQRKHPSDIIAAWRLFCEKMGKDKSSECALIMHTDPIDEFGTDLIAVKDLLVEDWMNVIFSGGKLPVENMNFLYNLADVTILVSSNEGWGLSTTESMMAGKMIIANSQGGMQDQMRFEDENGKWIEFTKDFCSNHFGTYKKCGEWAIPIFPSSVSLAGSVPTPYIFDSRLDFRDIAKAIEQVYDLSPEERKRRGLKGREWVMNDESNMEVEKMCTNVIEAIDATFSNWEPRKNYELVKIDKEYPKKKITHKLIY